MKSLFCLVLPVVLLASGTVRAQTVSDLSGRIDRIEKTLKGMNKKLSNNYVGSSKRVLDDDVERDSQDAAVMQAQDFEETIRQLTDDVERMNFERSNFYEKQKQIQDDITLRFNDLERRLTEAEKKIKTLTEEKEQAEKALQAVEKQRKAKEAADAKAEKEKAEKLKATYGKKEPKALYDEAFAAIKKQDYKAAEKQLEAFLELYPKNELAGNAQYWLGESFFARGQFEKAAIAFAEGFQKYRDSQKAPDNLFKLGLTMARLNKKEEACIAFKNFSKEYPKVSDGMQKRLQKEISKLSCP